MIQLNRLMTLASLLALVASGGFAQEEIAYIAGPSYPLTVCPVSGNKLAKPVVVEVAERRLKLCCKDCIPKIESDHETYLAKLDQAVIATGKVHYPLDKCPITQKALDSMGGPHDIVVGNRLIRLCCKGCEEKARAKSAEILKAIDQAALKAQLADYPLDYCPVMRAKLGSMGTPINYLHGTSLIRFCCKGCIRKFESNPQKYLGEIEKARALASKKAAAKKAAAKKAAEKKGL